MPWNKLFQPAGLRAALPLSGEERLSGGDQDQQSPRSDRSVHEEVFFLEKQAPPPRKENFFSADHVCVNQTFIIKGEGLDPVNVDQCVPV